MRRGKGKGKKRDRQAGRERDGGTDGSTEGGREGVGQRVGAQGGRGKEIRVKLRPRKCDSATIIQFRTRLQEPVGSMRGEVDQG